MTSALAHRAPDSRLVVAAVLAAVAGIGIGLMDAAPRFDDTGMTVGALVLASGVAAALAGRRPWLIAGLVGAWVPILEVAQGGGSAPLAALLFSSVGAGVGYVLGRTREPGR
ncbi:MAG TPA: hypothetical protein VKR30_01685 [Candidatus Limnocylindrales bacterium]|nr:hypothetical protein [Candidatus Limnocylindrales bacterium]